MKSLILFILCFKSVFLFSQNYISTTLRTITLDSIDIKFNYNGKFGGIEAESYFKNSKSKLRTIYYLEDDKTFHLIVVQEKSKNSEGTWRTNVFQFNDGKIFYQKESYYSKINGIAVEHQKDNNEIYRKAFNTEFLKKYIFELFEKIKNYH